ncbi:MAG: O-antigen ligase family protein [Phycisphaerae bacterium]
MTTLRLPSGPTAAGWLRRAVVVVAAAYLLVLPQFVTRASFFGVPGLPGPLAVLILSLGLWLMPVLLVASWAAEGRVRLPHAALSIPAVLFLVGAGVSTAAASDKSSALVRGVELAGLWAAAWALAQALRTDGERRFLLAVLVAAGCISAAVAIHQAAIGLPQALEYFEAHREEVLARQGIEPGGWREEVFRARFTGGVQAATGHPNVLAAMLLLALFAAAGLATEKWVEVRAAGARALACVTAAAGGLCGVGIVLTQSRAALAAACVGLYWLIVARRVRRRRLRIVLLLLPLAVAAAGLAVAAQVDHPAVAQAMTTLRYRLDYWSATLEILARHWATGVGLENFGSHYVEHKAAWAPEEVADPHHMLLSVWSTLGLAGLLALVLVWATAVRAWRRGNAERGGSEPVPSEAEGQPPRGTAESRGGYGDPPRTCGRAGLSGPEDESNDSRPGKPAAPPRGARRGGCGAPPRPVSAGTSLPALLVPTVALAGPAVFWFLADFFGGVQSAGGLAWGMGGVAGTAVLAGLLPSERPNRLAASDRPPDGLATAVVTGLLAFALAEQIGTAVLEPPTAWAMLVLLVATLGPGRARPNERAAGAETRRAHAAARPIGLAARFALVLAAMGFCFGYARLLIVPVAQEGRMLKEARFSLDTFGAQPTREAARVNPLAWEPAFLRGRLWHQRAAETGAGGPVAAIQLERAIEGYRAALARHPRLRRAYLAIADAYLAMPAAERDPALLAEARKALEAAAALYPTHIPTRLRLARLLDRMGRRRAARAEYEEVLRLDRLMPMAGRRLSEAERAEVKARLRVLPGPPDAPGAGASMS